jgi:site-specific DNA-cytosine methylase
MKKIKWCAIQPLTGGMYLGTEKATGCTAEFILTYPGFGDPIIEKKTGEIVGGGNEYHLMTYLDKVGRRPEYKVLNRKPFQNDDDMNPEILNHERWTLKPNKDLDYSNMDLVVAVPVCSGLSTATIGTQEAKEARNCNMIWISKYALRVIKPNVYIFENAPTFMGSRGDYLRKQLEALAEETGYSIVYYRTDTQYHDNCQKRKRTFIIFYKKEFSPKMDFERIETDYDEYFARDLHRFEELESGNKLVQEAILALLSHAIDGNEVDGLKDAKKSLQKYLIDK